MINNKKLILCRGIQGSGKSTWAKNWVNEDPSNRVRFNNDDIRNMLGKYWVPSREHIVNSLKITFLTKAMTSNYDIVIDNMNLNPKEVSFYKDIVHKHNNPTPEELKDLPLHMNYEIVFKDFFIPLETCIERDKKREYPIGENVIKETYNRYKDTIIEKGHEKQ